MHTRWMTRQDLEAVKAIDADGYEDPLTPDEWAEVLRSTATACIVAQSESTIEGFSLSTNRKGGKRVDLLRVAVRRASRRKGVGRKLIDNIRSRLPKAGTKILALVHEENAGGIAFLKALGFNATGVEKGAFGDRDGYAMVHTSNQEAKV